MSDLATGRTPSFSAAESIALYASSRRTWAKAAQREWKGLTSRLGKHRADVADSAGAAAPDPPAAASGTLGCELPFKFHSPWLKRRFHFVVISTDVGPCCRSPGLRVRSRRSPPTRLRRPPKQEMSCPSLPLAHAPNRLSRQHPISSGFRFFLSQARHSWLFHEFFPEQISRG